MDQNDTVTDQNNGNDTLLDNDFMDLDLSDFTPAPDLIRTCQNAEFDEMGNAMMPVISAEEPYPEVQETPMDIPIPEFNNQAELVGMEINPDKIQPQKDITLTELNGRHQSEYDDDNFGYQMEEKTYEDLSHSTAYSNPEIGGANGFYSEQVGMEFGLDQKSDFFQYQQVQPPAQVNRMEIVRDSQFVSDPYQYQMDQKMVYEMKPPSFLPSAQCSPSRSIDEYYRGDNNTNYSNELPEFFTTTVPTRSRKSSMTINHGKLMAGKKIIAKIAYEDAGKFRHRMTKAEKNKMTPEELRDRHLNQNKENAKKCVQNKNNKKKELTEKLEVLENNEKILEHYNKIQENGLLKAYEDSILPHYQNNAPFGLLCEFAEQIESVKKEVEVDNNGRIIEVQKLKENFEAKEAKFQKYQQPNKDPNLSQNTYASQKSRAKTEYELAKLQYSTAESEQKCENSMRFGAILEQLTQKINVHLRGLGRREMPVKIVYEGFEQFEPS